ncbi:hypothetical protein B566_EDAN012331 [Ephemera danica]|nr:hypothetical protein B566_EDAN012331 [Ephemera danica]
MEFASRMKEKKLVQTEAWMRFVQSVCKKEREKERLLLLLLLTQDFRSRIAGRDSCVATLAIVSSRCTSKVQIPLQTMIRPCHVWIAAAQCVICVTLLCYFILLNDAYLRMLSSLQQEYRRLDEAELGTVRWSGCPRGLVVTSQHVSRPRDTCDHVWDYLGVWAAAKRFGIFPTISSETLQLLGKSVSHPQILPKYQRDI